ncbi:13971_t:CDS:2 [Rhizophagus irregularis]|nr:13971_t:CDS:2 [Rhizophagus irregularis]
MAQNTRSKNSRKFAHTAQLEAHTSLTDEAIVAETYSDNSKSPPDQGLTKRTKIDTVLDETSSEPKVNNDMDIDKNLEKKNVVPSNSDAESRDPISADQQTPINTESDDMITDLPNKDTNGAIASGSSNTQNTQQQNNDEITRSILIFKENTSTTNCQYFIFFTKDQFDANKSNNEIINSIKNAFLTIHHAIGYKYQKKATLEFFTVQINNEECYNNIVDKPIALLNNITPRPYSKDLIDQLIATKLNKIEEYDQSSIIEKFDTPFNGAKLFIFLASQKKYTETCGYCGDDNHMINDCKETDYVILPNNRGRRFRKKFLARSNKFTMDDSNKSVYNRIRIITRSTPNEHNLNHNGPNQSLHSKPKHPNSTKYNYNQTQYQQPRHGKSINNTQSIPHGSWARPTEESGYNSSNKGKGREQNDDIVELKKQITHLNTIIKDLSSQIKGLDIVQKTHNKDIKLLQEQERRHAEDIEKIRVECEKTNTTITKQSEIISDIPEMASILRNISNSGILTRYQPQQEAYGTHNYAHPPHNLYVEEHVHQQEEIYSEYEDSNNGYESSDTINTRIFPDDDNYTPSHPTSSSFPSITSRVGGFLGLHQRQQ